MSTLRESCTSCGWKFEHHFRYHGGVPVEHPLCPTCGGALAWDYHFEERHQGFDPDAMLASIKLDEAGFPEDHSPRNLALGQMLDAKLTQLEGAPLRVRNVAGVADMELRPFVGATPDEDGIKLVANVGTARYSVGLLELLSWINRRLPVGQLTAHTSTYGSPPGTPELFPFGAEVGLYFQHVIPQDVFEAEDGQSEVEACERVAAELATQLRQMARLHPGLEPPAAPPAMEPPLAMDELTTSAWGTRELESVPPNLFQDLFLPAPDTEEIHARVEGFLEELGLQARWQEGELRFALDSARVTVSVIERAGRLLLRYQSVLLDNVDVQALPGGAQLPARVLTTLNDQTMAGRCLLELPPEATPQDARLRITFEKTLLATDLDLGEFALTLVMVAEEADRIDNVLQDAFGGLRADQADQGEAEDLTPLLRRLASQGLPDVTRRGEEAARTDVRHMLEEMNLAVREGQQGEFWFCYGSARLFARTWADGRATYLTLRARVLRDVERTQGLAEVLNDLNLQTHFGAFSLRQDRHVELTETILADELSIEELSYALLTLGELADVQDNKLQELFGGELANQ
jgi:hypothetical protein